MKRISEKKLEAFAVGIMGKRQLSKKELEEQKKKEDEAAAAHAFQEFVETFQQTTDPSSKVWIKAGTYDAGSRKEDIREKGKLYKPSSKLDDKSATDKAQEYAKMLASDLKKDTLPLRNKKQEKKKSNLELFKEELRQIQEEREERHKYKHIISTTNVVTHTNEQHTHVPEIRENTTGSYDNGDPNTTNLYLGNLSPKISEQQLMEIFGRYGPLASIKIMWPRSEEEKQRGRNCGFVAYMSRKDAERALKTLNGRYVMGYEMRLGWGKAVPIMNQPIFIPPPLLELTMPPPPSGLPFNAQPPLSEIANIPQKNYKEYVTDEEKENMQKVLRKAVVKVIVPTEKTVLHVIHRMIEFVIREGPLFEALIMSREIDNPMFSFLFDNESPAHIYYRWKLFSLLQGDTPSEWNEKEFRMFQDGAIWRPPVANFYTQGMPDELVNDPEAPEIHKGALSTAQRDRLEDLIRHITPERTRIADAMIFCIEHADAADEICECIAESLANITTQAYKKVARLYLVSDILHNCTVKVSNASFFRKSIENNLPEIFENLHAFYKSIESRLKAERFKSRVLNVLRAWNDWTVYSKDFLAELRLVFLGKQNSESPSSADIKEESDDIDGAPLSGDEKEDEDLDGVPLDGAALLKGVLMRGLPDTYRTTTSIVRSQEVSQDNYYNDDIDGMPLDDEIDGVPFEKVSNNLMESPDKGLRCGAFIPSKWETVDPHQVEAQAVTMSKWDTLDTGAQKSDDGSSQNDGDNDSNSYDFYIANGALSGKNSNYDEVKRNQLRELEVKVVQYQDELESGQRELKPGWTISEQVEFYRKKLLKKEIRNEADNSPLNFPQQKNIRRSETPDSLKRSRSRKRSHSPNRHDISPASSSRGSNSRFHTKRHKSTSSSSSSPTQLMSASLHNLDRTGYKSKSTKQDSPLPSSILHRSMSPNQSRNSRRDRETYLCNTSHHRNDKHKHKYKH